MHPDLRRFPLVHVEDLNDPTLSADSQHHLIRSLRFTDGDVVNLTDGAGRWAPAVFLAGSAVVELTGAVRTEPREGPIRAVLFAPTKGVRPEWVVTKLTELGIDRIGILRTKRSVVSYDGHRAERLLKKLPTVISEACQQCRRVDRPEVLGPLTLIGALAKIPELFLCDPDGQPAQSLIHAGLETVSAAVGPEGGWSPSEVELAPLVALPGRVLRADTAAIAAAVCLSFGQN